jgi:hypothetical protein
MMAPSGFHYEFERKKGTSKEVPLHPNIFE